MARWVTTAEAASIAGMCSTTFRHMSKHRYYGLERSGENGSVVIGRNQFFNSDQIERAVELRRMSGVTFPAAITVVVAQNGKPPEPWTVPTVDMANKTDEFSQIKRRINQIRLLLPDRPIRNGRKCAYNSERFRQIDELLSICNKLLIQLESH